MNTALHPIGKIRTPYRTLEDCPRNTNPQGPECELLIDRGYTDGLSGLSEGQHIVVLYWFENADRNRLVQTRRKTGQECGVFALRSPHRPNPVALALVKIEGFTPNGILVRGMDCLDGTPLLDIKPALGNERIALGPSEPDS